MDKLIDSLNLMFPPLDFGEIFIELYKVAPETQGNIGKFMRAFSIIIANNYEIRVRLESIDLDDIIFKIDVDRESAGKWKLIGTKLIRDKLFCPYSSSIKSVDILEVIDG